MIYNTRNFDKISVGKNIKRFRRQKHMTQKQLAEAIGVENEQHISNIETGKKAASLYNYINIANALNVGMNEIFSDCLTCLSQKECNMGDENKDYAAFDEASQWYLEQKQELDVKLFLEYQKKLQNFKKK